VDIPESTGQNRVTAREGELALQKKAACPASTGMVIPLRRFEFWLALILPAIAGPGCGGDAVVAVITRGEIPVEGGVEASAPDGPASAPDGAASAPDGAASAPDGPAPLPDLVTGFVQPCDFSTPKLPELPGSLCEEGGWCWDSPSPTGRGMSSIARVGEALWVASQDGILRFDGASWAPLASPLADSKIRQVWGTADGVGFAASGHEVARFDGKEWQTWSLRLPDDVFLDGEVYNLTGRSATDLWAVVDAPTTGDGGTFVGRRITHFDGASWTTLAPPPPTGLTEMSVVSATDIWGISDGYLVHFDGKSWEPLRPPENPDDNGNDPWLLLDFYMVHATSATDVWISAGSEPLPDADRDPGNDTQSLAAVLFRHDGTRFTQVEIPPVHLITAIYGSDPNDLWFGTQVGEYLHWDGKAMTLEESPSSIRTVMAFAQGADGKMFSVEDGPWPLSDGASGAIVERVGDVWSDRNASGTVDYARKTWGSAWNDVWAVGTRGLRLHFDGERWEKRESARTTITGIWGSAKNDVWTVTEGGDIEHFDGSTWSRIYESRLLFSDVWGIGNGEIWMSVTSQSFGRWRPGDPPVAAARFVEGRLDSFAIEIEGNPRSIWASSTRDVWLGTAGEFTGRGELFRFDGRSWTRSDFRPSWGGARDIWGRGANDVYVTGGGYEVFRFDGTTWTESIPFVSGYNGRGLDAALWGCDDHVFIADNDGMAVFDGTEWSSTRQYTYGITGLWAASPNFAVAVGYGGQILRKSR
jgi:hypothetical protein